MNNDAEYIAAVMAAPDDDAPRLAYASMLTSRGDPRGEFIRISCEAAKASAVEIPPLHALLDELLGKYHAEWQKEISPDIVASHYDRGFIHTIIIDPNAFLAQADHIMARGPIRALNFSEIKPANGWADSMAKLQQLQQLRSLDLFCPLNPTEMRSFLSSPNLCHLQKLSFSDANCESKTAEAVSNARDLTELTALEFLGFQGDGIKDSGVRALSESAHLAGLTRLDLRENHLGPESMKTLASSAVIRNLKSLYLGDGFYGANEIGSDGALEIARSTNFGHLEELHANFNAIGDAGFVALLTSPSIGPLRELSVVSCGLTATSMKLFSESRSNATLKYLDLGCNEFGDEGAIHLAGANFQRLATLSLGGTNLTVRGLARLLQSPWLKNLSILRLNGGSLGAEGIDLLLTSPALDLMTLMIDAYSLGSRGDLLRQRFGSRLKLEGVMLPSLGQADSYAR